MRTVSLTAPSDETLMALCAAGSDSAFAALVERHSPAVYRYFHVTCRDRDLAWDLVQETFLRVHKHRDRYRTGGTFRNWLFVIAANLARSDRRTRLRRPTNDTDREGRRVRRGRTGHAGRLLAESARGGVSLPLGGVAFKTVGTWRCRVERARPPSEE